MTTHAAIKTAIAEAVAGSTAVRDFCVEHFGRGALVVVDWFGAEGAPGERESPFIFIYSLGETQSGFVDEETFSFTIEVGATAGAAPRRNRVAERTGSANGVVVNGVADLIEELREIVIGIVREGAFGATLRNVSRTESSTLAFPLEWALATFEFFEPQTL